MSNQDVEAAVAFWMINLALIYIGLALVIGIYSRRKGGSFIAGFLMALLISPLLAGLIVMVRSPRTAAIEHRAVQSGELKKCPSCAELIKAEAVKCRFCGSVV